MQAWRIHEYGGPEVLRLDDVDIPKPSKGQVQVKISKAGINPFDWKIRDGMVKDFVPLPLPKILGVDFVGSISALGEGASRFNIGDRVMTFTEDLEAFAEYKTVDHSVLAHVPDGLSDEQAMTLPIPALTAWQMLHTAQEMKSGMKVLVQGASGLVGAFAVQFAKAAGCYVYATASAKNGDYVKSLGADRFIDYAKEEFEKVVEEVDLVVDCVLIGGAMNTTDRSWGILKSGGAIVSVADPTVGGKAPSGKQGFFPRITPDASALEVIAKQLASGEVQTKVAKVFARSELPEAMELNKKGGTAGRIMTDFSSN